MTLKVIEPWFADGLKFSCTGCGDCCTGGPGYIWISDEEIRRLAEFLKMPMAAMMQKYCRNIDGHISIKEKVPNARGEYDCIFLKEVSTETTQDGQRATVTKRICEVYRVRPLQCRTWPFWKENLSTPEAWAAAKKRCRGMNTGQTWPSDKIIAQRDATDWPKES